LQDIELAEVSQEVSGRFSRARAASGHAAADERDELAAFYLIELHSISNSPRGMQDIELAMVSQRVYDHALARARAR
jgi:hypothetical protein